MWKKTDFLFYLRIIIEFQSMFNWIAQYWQAQNNDNNNITYLQKKKKKTKTAQKTYSGVGGQHYVHL